MQVTAILKSLKSAERVSEKFTKREFIATIEPDSQYSQPIWFQLSQTKCSLIDGIEIGARLEIHFNLRGKEWTSPQGELKCFTTLDVWKIERLS